MPRYIRREPLMGNEIVDLCNDCWDNADDAGALDYVTGDDLFVDHTDYSQTAFHCDDCLEKLESLDN